MLFNSFQFVWFLPLIVMIYYSLKPNYRWMLLLAASYYFYMCWRVEYVVLILFSTLLDYWAAIKMESAKTQGTKKLFLSLSLLGNLGMLFTFKYFDFFLYNSEAFLTQFNVFYDSPLLDVLLPMGISFYTFQTLSYTIDVYKGRAKAEKHLGYFALYVTYFPQLVAGPIERASRLIPQLRNAPIASADDIRYGINKILLGFFKKVVVADNVGMFCDQMFAYPVHGSGLLYLVSITLFVVQLFADFSGYTDIAIGTARLMGVRLMENFNRPLWSSNMSDFWSKWHISLTSWIGDYIFKPLMFKYPKHANLITLLVMTTVGFWHGASWNFIIFGLLHGSIIIIQRHYRKVKTLQPFGKTSFGKNLYSLWNFVLLAITGVFFRNELWDALTILKHIATDTRLSLLDLRSAYQTEMFLAIAVSFLLLLTVLTNRELRFRYNTLYVAVLLLTIFLFGVDNQNQFIYFQF
jgi:alginate O-acetyltransferase complex protein AlgI